MTTEEAIGKLDVFTTEDGRRVVHTRSGGFGADWDEAEAVAFIGSADELFLPGALSRALRHGVGACKDGRDVVFATKGGE